MKITEQKVIRFIEENNLLNSGDKILVALSGGPDSVFLLHFLNKFKKKFKIEIGAVHINHKLRGKNSDRDELFCKTICFELSIPFYSTKKDVKAFAVKNKLSIELAARKIRYDFFEKILQEFKYDKILTAHNADDNVETVLLNLVKGAGLKGIAGIPVKRDKIIRPILCLTKKEILNYLEANQFEYRIDESNLTVDYERNFLRNKIVPLLFENINPSISKSVLTTSLNIQNLVNEIDLNVKKIKSKLKLVSGKVVSFPNEVLRNDQYIYSYLIKDVIDECFSVKLESSDIKKIFSLAKKQTGKSEELTNNLVALKERDKILVKYVNVSAITKPVKIKIGDKITFDNQIIAITSINPDEINFTNSKNVEYISADNIKKDFIVRQWNNGDRFFPIGMSGTKKVSDYLNDIKINSFEKKNYLILENDKRIIWIIGQRLDERFKVTPNTKKVLQLCLN